MSLGCLSGEKALYGTDIPEYLYVRGFVYIAYVLRHTEIWIWDNTNLTEDTNGTSASLMSVTAEDNNEQKLMIQIWQHQESLLVFPKTMAAQCKVRMHMQYLPGSWMTYMRGDSKLPSLSSLPCTAVGYQSCIHFMWWKYYWVLCGLCVITSVCCCRIPILYTFYVTKVLLSCGLRDIKIQKLSNLGNLWNDGIYNEVQHI